MLERRLLSKRDLKAVCMKDYNTFTEQEFRERFSRLFRLRNDGKLDRRHEPKPGTSKRSQTTNNRHSRYRKRQQIKGRCPRCGKPAAPFNECREHRESRACHRALQRLVASGEIRIIDRDAKNIPIYEKVDKQHASP